MDIKVGAAQLTVVPVIEMSSMHTPYPYFAVPSKAIEYSEDLLGRLIVRSIQLETLEVYVLSNTHELEFDVL